MHTGTLCGETCNNQVKFDANKSSTWVESGEEDEYISFATGVGVDPVSTTEDDWYLLLHKGNDTIAVGGVSVPEVEIYLITYQTPTFSPDPFSGIQGRTDKNTDSLLIIKLIILFFQDCPLRRKASLLDCSVRDCPRCLAST